MPSKRKRKSGARPTGASTPAGRSQKSTGAESRITIRPIREEEAEAAAELVSRLKRLNGEFDPLLKTTESLESESLRALRKAMGRDDSVVLVATIRKKVIGVVKADIRDRIFYEPRREGAIVEFYLLPEFRRGSVGRDLFLSMVNQIKSRKAELITAEFPSQNEIARRFYSKLGFRAIVNLFGKKY